MLRRMTSWFLRWLLRTFLAAGWTAADVLHALDVRPDDSRWTYTWTSVAELRHIPGWVRHRLAAWLDEDGQVVASRSQRRAAADARRRAEQEARRQALLAAGWVPAPRPAEDADTAASVVPADRPNDIYRAARAEMESRRQEKEAALAAWRARRRAS